METPGFKRFAIYWTPEDTSDFAAFGRAWFSNAGPLADRSNAFGLPPELAARATKSPARYGLHATLKAPFRLGNAVTQRVLDASLTAFCTGRRRASAGPLRLSSFDGFLGLVPQSPTTEIDWLAAECVTYFDHFRAPLSEDDRERRHLDRLTVLERDFFEGFGYPHILSLFQFHITLAGPLRNPEIDIVEQALNPVIKSFCNEPFSVDHLSLMGEPTSGGPFELLHRFTFGCMP